MIVTIRETVVTVSGTIGIVIPPIPVKTKLCARNEHCSQFRKSMSLSC